MTESDQRPEFPLPAKAQRWLYHVNKRLQGRELEGRVGHFCVGGRCKPARVKWQAAPNKVDLHVVLAPNKTTSQLAVTVLKQRSQERSFHLLSQCDRVAIIDGEYRDIDSEV